MPGMRVHELAKEYGLSSKDMLDRLRDMKIPAKSHASMLGDAYVQKIRKEMGPASVEGDVEEGVAVNTVEAEELEAKKKAEEEERVRREAVEKERARREAERAKRKETKDAVSAEAEPKRAVPASDSPFKSLEAQIADEKERVRREREAAAARARAEALAKDVAKKQAVEEAIRLRQGGHKATAQAESRPAAKPAPAAPAAKKSRGFDSLLSQIESEQKRIQEQKAQNKEAGKRQNARNNNNGKPAKKKHHNGEQVVPELENAGTE